MSKNKEDRFVLGSFLGNLKVCIYKCKNEKPHCHVIDEKENRDICVCLDKASYYKESNQKFKNLNEVLMFDAFMSDNVISGSEHYNRWFLAVLNWNGVNENCQIDDEVEKPTYANLILEEPIDVCLKDFLVNGLKLLSPEDIGYKKSIDIFWKLVFESQRANKKALLVKYTHSNTYQHLKEVAQYYGMFDITDMPINMGVIENWGNQFSIDEIMKIIKGNKPEIIFIERLPNDSEHLFPFEKLSKNFKLDVIIRLREKEE